MASIPPSYSSFYRFLCKKQPDSCQILYEFMKLKKRTPLLFKWRQGAGGGGGEEYMFFNCNDLCYTSVIEN